MKGCRRKNTIYKSGFDRLLFLSVVRVCLENFHADLCAHCCPVCVNWVRFLFCLMWEKPSLGNSKQGPVTSSVSSWERNVWNCSKGKVLPTCMKCQCWAAEPLMQCSVSKLHLYNVHLIIINRIAIIFNNNRIATITNEMLVWNKYSGPLVLTCIVDCTFGL